MSPRLDIRLMVSSGGCLRGFEAAGHAGAAPAGSNIACAAATSLLRTAGTLCANRGLAAEASADGPGLLRLVVTPAAEGDWLRGVTDFLLRGLNDLAREFPREVLVRMETTEV